MKTATLAILLVAPLFLSSCARDSIHSPSASTDHRSLITPPPHSAASLPGPKPDGSVLLPNQWSLRPVGRQIELGDFPVNIAVHPAGHFAAILHCGESAHKIVIVNLDSTAVISTTPIHEAFYGLEFSADGRTLYCSGAGDEVVHQFEFRDGKLTPRDDIRVHDPKLRAVPSGLAVDVSRRRLYVANLWADRVTRIALDKKTTNLDLTLGTNSSPIALAPVAPPTDFEDYAATKREEASQYIAGANDAFPYACRLDEKRGRLYVSAWAQSAVAVIDLKSEKVIALWPTGQHPCEMALTRSGKFLFVANANLNTVTVLDTATGRALETITTSLYPNSPPGSTPNSLALSPDEKTLFVANADNNTVAVFDVISPGKSRSLGFIPVGWYPTSVRVTPDGKHLLVANGKGVVPKANPLGPQPGVNLSKDATVQYIAHLFNGTLSVIDLPSRPQFERQLKDYTAAAYRCSPLKSDASVSAPRQRDNPVPSKPGDPSPIKYCLYIIKENRTYDQVLGDMPQGNGDTNLCLFPEPVTPNHHKLARDFVLLDNFYVESEVSADGHEWTMGAYATDFVEKNWPMSYGHNASKKFPYPAEGYFPIAFPAGGYLWDRAQEAGVTYRSYGEFVEFRAPTNRPATARTKALQGHIDEWYRGFDMAYPDQLRATRFIQELNRMEAAGDMPRLQIIRLPSDHTHGATPGWRTPAAYLADNDLALGRIVEAVSRSRFWPQTAIFVVEDDAQNGPDHVDAHRTIAYAISPYTRRGIVDSTMYSTSSMLRTMELILGLKPMSQFDAAATPMFNSFQANADTRPYEVVTPQVNLDALNSSHAWGGELKLNFAREDAVDDLLLTEIVWRAVRGSDHPAPAPVRAAFVFPHPTDKDDD